MHLSKVYIKDNAAEIDACFEYLQANAQERNLDMDVISKMKAGWEKEKGDRSIYLEMML